MSTKGIATDVDHLVSLGYPVEVVRKTLELTKGDKEAAIKILATGGIKRSDTNWRKESANDWLDGVSTNVPKNDVNRALHKSPVYISVASYHRKTNDVEYKLNVTLKNGKQWSIMRTYDQFSRLKGNLPMGTCLNFTNGFPLPNVFHFLFTEESAEFLEKRRNLLGEWIRELTLDESCMTNTKVLDALSYFIDLQTNCGVGVTLLKLPTAESVSNSAPFTDGISGPETNTSPLIAAYATNDNEKSRQLLLNCVPVLREDQFPLVLNVMRESLPFKVDIRKLECGREQIAARQAVKEKRLAALAEDSSSPVDQSQYWDATHSATSPAAHNNSSGSNDIEIDEKQLRKDLSRDRIIVQGRKVAGSATELDAVVDICKQAILQTVIKAGHQLSAVRHDPNSGSSALVRPPPPPPGNYTGLVRSGTTSPGSAVQETSTNHSLQMLDYVSKAALQQISRTESAFLSHSALMELLDVNDTKHTADFSPFLVVPESTLAEPLVLNFRVQERNASKESSDNNSTSMYNISHHITHVPVASVVSHDTANELRAHHMADAVAHPAALEEAQRPLSRSTSVSSLHEWCVVCEGEASTVYRVMDAETMETTLQIKVTFVYSLFALPVVETSGRAERVVDFRLKEGKTFLLIAKDTTSTARDWKGPR